MSLGGEGLQVPTQLAENHLRDTGANAVDAGEIDSLPDASAAFSLKALAMAEPRGNFSRKSPWAPAADSTTLMSRIQVV